MLVTDKNDLEAILDIQRKAFLQEAIRYEDLSMPPMVETLEQMEAMFENGTVFFKYILDDRIVGSVRGKLDNGACHIGRLIVLPDHQNKGIGKILMNELETFFSTKCQSFKIFTGEKSIHTINLYTRLDYKIIHTQNEGDYSLIFMEKVIGNYTKTAR